MMKKAGIAGAALLLTLAAGSSQYAAAQSEQKQSATQQGKAVMTTATPTGTATSAVSRPNVTGAAPRPLDRVGLPLTAAECTGLGGTVTTTVSKSCSATHQMCYRADQNGVIHSSCITAG